MQGAGRSCLRGRGCRTGKRRCRRSRIRLSSFLQGRRGLRRSRRRLRGRVRRWAGLRGAGAGLRGRGCRMGTTRPRLRRSLGGRRRQERRGLLRSRSCLLCRACRRTGRRGPESCLLRRSTGKSCLRRGRSCLAGKGCSRTVLLRFGTCLRCSWSSRISTDFPLKCTSSDRSCRIGLPICVILANSATPYGSSGLFQSRNIFR